MRAEIHRHPGTVGQMPHAPLRAISPPARAKSGTRRASTEMNGISRVRPSLRPGLPSQFRVGLRQWFAFDHRAARAATGLINSRRRGRRNRFRTFRHAGPRDNITSAGDAQCSPKTWTLDLGQRPIQGRPSRRSGLPDAAFAGRDQFSWPAAEQKGIIPSSTRRAGCGVVPARRDCTTRMQAGSPHHNSGKRCRVSTRLAARP